MSPSTTIAGRRQRERARERERGYLMAGLVAAVAIMMIFSTIAFQAWEDVKRRDDEAEMIFRAEEITRAIQKYRRDHGGLTPEKLEELMEPGPRGQYYLRRLYDDPLVPDGKWGLLYLGPGGQIIDPAAVEPAAGGLVPPAGQSGSGLDLQQPGGMGLQPTGQPGGTPGASGLPGGIGNANQAAGQQLGGLRLAGVRTLSTDDPFRYYRGFTSYSEWLFTFLDLELHGAQGQAAQQPGQQAGQPGAQPGQPGGQRPIVARPRGSAPPPKSPLGRGGR